MADFSPEQLSFLTFGRGIDTTRMRTVLGFEPRLTTVEAFDDFARGMERPLGLSTVLAGRAGGGHHG